MAYVIDINGKVRWLVVRVEVGVKWCGLGLRNSVRGSVRRRPGGVAGDVVVCSERLRSAQWGLRSVSHRGGMVGRRLVMW